MKKHKVGLAMLLTLAVVLLLGGWLVATQRIDLPLKSVAEARAKAYARAIDLNYAEPGGIYDFMTLDYQQSISREAFIEAFRKERSYPYLTPLWINYKRIEMDNGNRSGTAIYDQAARLKGMVYTVPIRYENFKYRMVDFEEFPDGSYLEKFDHIPNYLLHGWD